jgi:Winged helix-turn helix
MHLACPLTLTEEERHRLQSLAHRVRSQSLPARQARVALACAEGCDNKTVAKKLRCSTGMVGKWHARFLQARLEGLYDKPRPGVLPQRISMVDPFRYATADAILAKDRLPVLRRFSKHQGKAKPSRSPSLIWNVKARMSSFR